MGRQCVIRGLFEGKKRKCQIFKRHYYPSGISLTSDISPELKDNHLVVSATPTPYLRSVLTKFLDVFSPEIPMVSVTKGIENDTLMTPSEIITNVLGKRPVSLLLGPSHAEEVAHGVPTTVVVSSKDDTLARIVQGVFTTDRFRVYTNPDVTGVELGAAMKNVIAIAAGICDGLKFGDNSKAALISRGLAEISRLGIAMGAEKSTFSGLTGLGDLITTCISLTGGIAGWVSRLEKGKNCRKFWRRWNRLLKGYGPQNPLWRFPENFPWKCPLQKKSTRCSS
ncbi:MAG: glycerol-3-phosphate dehydrogenase [Candidatus Brocadia fulgida]|uniref:Glycerol-3-phosphate dehydrogenase n=1 Tax=Candidatus Brocadia fulgida TaxID=380242 RepID=A0A0M2USD9_9BACT|nr:MAG: glycerol-3-phosphate dehydrogenase [Candidatus Brocadia fulgida]